MGSVSTASAYRIHPFDIRGAVGWRSERDRVTMPGGRVVGHTAWTHTVTMTLALRRDAVPHAAALARSVATALRAAGIDRTRLLSPPLPGLAEVEVPAINATHVDTGAIEDLVLIWDEDQAITLTAEVAHQATAQALREALAAWLTLLCGREPESI